jgi:predicted N-acetyltransferase YhbS
VALPTGTVSIDHLCLHPEHTTRVAGWIHGAFWTRSGHDVQVVIDLLHAAHDPDRIPLSLLAQIDSSPVGTVNLIVCDSKARPDLTPWLAALFVHPEHRGKEVGAALVQRLVAEAARLGYEEVFLETDIPEFYARLGATRYEALAEGGWIMRIRAADAGHPSQGSTS